MFVAAWALIGDAGETYDLTNIGTLFAFMLVSIGVLVLRYKEPDRPRPFRVPFVWAVSLLSAAGCLFIMYGLPGRPGSASASGSRSGWCCISCTATATVGCVPQVRPNRQGSGQS